MYRPTKTNRSNIISNKAKHVADQMADKANETLTELENNVRQTEETLKAVSSMASQVAQELGVDLKEQAAESVSAAEGFIREKPLQAAGLAFGAGVLATLLMRARG